MSDMQRLVMILIIMMKYKPKYPDLSASHDKIYFGGPEPDSMDPDDRAAVESAGASYDMGLRWMMQL